MNKLMKFLNLGEQGFSMVQGLIAAAVIGGVSVAIVQQNKLTTQQTRAAATNFAIVELQGQIQNYLLSEGACTSSFSGGTLALTSVGQSQPVTTIRDKLGTVVFQTGNKYNLNQVSIPSMRFTRTATGGTLTVMFLKEGNDNRKGIGARDARKDYDVSATWNAAGNLTKCYSDLSNAVDTAVLQAIARFCPDPAAPNPTGIYFDAGTGLCESTAQFGTTAIQTPCPGDQAVTGLVYDNTTRQYSKVCNSIYTIPATCPVDTLLRRRSDGSFDCVKPECPGNAIFTGLDGSGNSQCLSCGAGQVAMVIAGSWSCQNIRCDSPAGQQYFMGFDTTGNPVCNNLVASSDCPGGGRLVATGAGSVAYECCTPDCGDTTQACQGTVYASANSCGVCSGTKAPDCGNPAAQCIGSYPSANGCGSCTGQMGPQPGTWGAWTGSSEFRAKPDASCNCALNTITQERKYNRTCTLGMCGGAACNGSNEEWLIEGTTACAPGSCAPIPIAWQLYDDLPYNADNNIKFYNQTRGTSENQAWGPYSSGNYVGGYAGDVIYIENNHPTDDIYYWDPGAYASMQVYVDGVTVYDQTVYSEVNHGHTLTLEAGKTYSVFSRAYLASNPTPVDCSIYSQYSYNWYSCFVPGNGSSTWSPEPGCTCTDHYGYNDDYCDGSYEGPSMETYCTND